MSRRDEIINARLVKEYKISGSSSIIGLIANIGFDAAIEEVRRLLREVTGNWAASNIKTVEVYKILDSLTEGEK